MKLHNWHPVRDGIRCKTCKRKAREWTCQTCKTEVDEATVGHGTLDRMCREPVKVGECKG